MKAKSAGAIAALDKAKQHVMQIETRRKQLELDVETKKGQIEKYGHQQFQTRKNDEYQALGKEIEHTQQVIGALEEQELGVMYQIDEAKKRYAVAEATLKGNISKHEAKLATLKQRDANLAAELVTAQAAAVASREGVPEISLRVYERVAKRNWPVVVPLRGGKCGGCHLKVSSEAESGSRSADPLKLGVCDQCGRILYWDYA